jgi:hypothetical protein
VAETEGFDPADGQRESLVERLACCTQRGHQPGRGKPGTSEVRANILTTPPCGPIFQPTCCSSIGR